ncbi:36370_t:CDS:2, partial [Racocetra persica]
KLTSSNRHLMLIKERCGVGKSNKIAEEIRTLCHSDESSVSTLIIFGRRSLAHGQKVIFEGFKSYLELDAKKLNPKDTPKLIISPESIHKLEQLAMIGSTMKKPKLSHDVYKSLLQSALLILALDATLDSDSLNVELIGALRQELKVYIPMFAKTEKKKIFANINNAVASLDYLIATPVMTCGVNITVKNFDMIFVYFRILAEEAHCDKILTPDSRWIFKPNASLETHLYNASRRNASRNDFVSLLTDHLSEYGYNINIAKDCPSIDSKLTENNEGKELLLQVHSIKKTLDTEKYSMITNAQVLSDIEALDIRECLEKEEDIDLAYRLALQKYNLASFYRKTLKI